MNEELLERYTPEQKLEILRFLNTLAERTRKSKRISESRKDNIVREWENFDPDVVLAALRLFVSMKTSSAQGEQYIKGIMRNKQREKDVKLNGKNRRGSEEGKSRIGKKKCGDEGERLQGIIGAISDESLDCDF